MYLSLHGLDFALLPGISRGVLRVKYWASSLDTSTLMIPMRLLYDKTHVRNNRFRGLKPTVQKQNTPLEGHFVFKKLRGPELHGCLRVMSPARYFSSTPQNK